MAEIHAYEVEVTVNFECPSGDGGLLIYADGEIKDDANFGPFVHRCTFEKDDSLYKLEVRYPRKYWQALDVDAIPGLKI